MELARLEELLEEAWSPATCDTPTKWTKDNPSFGQCAVTACLVQDYFGGHIVNAYAEVPGEEKPVSHYWNIINGEAVDLTRKQFPEGTIIPEGQPKRKDFPSTRAYVLSYTQTLDRYLRLKKEVNRLDWS